MKEQTYIYPFQAIVGQEKMKLALILNMIDPSIGGVLIRGEKGTAKSTAVRGITALLAETEKVSGCFYNCYPQKEMYFCDDCKNKLENDQITTVSRKRKVVELPVSATEDRVVGTLNIETAIKKGEKEFEPGILAEANNNILYVDEVNLLNDHIVDVLLDSAAMGVNTIEREGVSFSHPARFVLIGTMNPEEGDLRPQLLDRFGLVVEITGEKDPKDRKEVVKRRLAFEADPEAFIKKYQGEEKEIKERITKAIKSLDSIEIPEIIYDVVANLVINLGVDGHRADITLIKAAKALAAYYGDKTVEKKHLILAAQMALPHRMRRMPFEEAHFNESVVNRIINDYLSEKN